jgi:peptide methionine sulfoxide reductase msrA/msrB
MRYCINSASLRFVPASKLQEEGYGDWAKLFASKGGADAGTSASGASSTKAAAAPSTATEEVAIFAGGCFWGVEDLIRKLPGVLSTEVGYAGGALDNPKYGDVKTGSTGHAEAVQIVFDPKKLSYEQLLHFFFRIHDPTTRNRQGNDVGSQYRSAIFAFDDAQKRIAEKVRGEVDRSGKWKSPVVTEILPAARFYPAESYHQDYLLKNPGGYTCHYIRD